METNINQAAEAPEQQLLPSNQALTSGDFKTMEESELNHFAIFERLQKYIFGPQNWAWTIWGIQTFFWSYNQPCPAMMINCNRRGQHQRMHQKQRRSMIPGWRCLFNWVNEHWVQLVINEQLHLMLIYSMHWYETFHRCFIKHTWIDISCSFKTCFWLNIDSAQPCHFLGNNLFLMYIVD